MASLSIKIPNVSESLEEKLEEMVLGGAFWPDQPITSERRLADEFDVSRTSLRTALAHLLERGLLTQVGKRYFATNVMADLLGPVLTDIAKEAPLLLLDYWVLLFADAIKLGNQKAQGSDTEAIAMALKHLQDSVSERDATDVASRFNTLSRAIFDSCYNFFLSQTHQSLMTAIQPQIALAFTHITDDPKRAQDFSKALEAIVKTGSHRTELHQILELGFVDQSTENPKFNTDFEPVDSTQLVDVVLRNPLFLEAVYELRLITERHAAEKTADSIGPQQEKQLVAHLEYMTAIADSAPSQYSKLDTELHRLLADCTRNTVFSVVNAALAPVFSRTTNQWLKKHTELQHDHTAIHIQHAKIVKAIVEQDSNKAQAAITEHLDYVLRNLRHLREQDQFQEIAIARRLLR